MKKPNQLIKEKSPYLLQHAYNPVNWYAWSEEAFEIAAKEDKPVFLSIGYSTCHWCHVMEKESFEDEEVAELLNDAFVSIKVDREERPDIDGIYMNVCQMLTGSGGWPLTIVMTPGKQPFFAGTYFPKHNRFGRAGLIDLIPRLKEVWRDKREDIFKTAGEISNALINSNSASASEEIDKYILDRGFQEFYRRYDKDYGGFNTSPKFPTPHNIYFLFRYWKRTGNPDALEMAEKTLNEMRKGGMYDHIGFGFHRYSTDRKWLVPHFEKMLYDQALLATAYSEAYLVTKKDLYKKTAQEILEYVNRDMTSPEGGFYSAEDADSEGVEGKFYLWREEEIKEILTVEAELFCKIFNVTRDGNWIDPVHGTEDGTNIIHLRKTLDKLSVELNIPLNQLEDKLKDLRNELFEQRESRVHPYKDDKILTEWNGLMISAFAKAAQVFDEPGYSLIAEKAANFILNNLSGKNGALLHRFRDGEAALPGYIDDYAFFIAALIDLYEVTFKTEYLKEAIRLTDYSIEHFWDTVNNAFFFTSDDSEKLLFRQKEIYDGAIPSGNSVSLLNLLRLSRLTGNISYEEKANSIAKTFAVNINHSPSAFSQALTAIDFAFGPSYEFVIAEGRDTDTTNEFLKYTRERFIPNKVVLLKNRETGNNLDDIAPFSRDYTPQSEKTAIFVCENFKCSLPATSIEELKKLITKELSL